MINKLFVRLLLFNLFISGQCIIAQMCLSIGLSYIISNSIFVFTFFTGLYLMAMGIGVLLVEKFRLSSEQWIKCLLSNCLVAVAIANPGIIGLLLGNELASYWLRASGVDVTWIIFPLGIILSVILGIAAGAEIPIFSKLTEQEQWHFSTPIIGVLSSDYLGAFLGIMIFAFVLYPLTGLIGAILISQVATMIAADYFYVSVDVFRKRLLSCLVLLAANLYVVIMYVNKDTLRYFLDSISGF